MDGPNPYFICKDNKLSQVRKFDIKNYIDESWNESYNCSSYSTKEDAEIIAKNLKASNLRCPVDKNVCQKLSAKYAKISSEVKSAILSPLCLNPDSKFSQVEVPIDATWEDIKKGSKGLTFEIAWQFIKGKVKQTMESKSNKGIQ